MFLRRFFPVIILITLITQTTMAQKQNDYAAQWKKVEGFESKGLPKSALKEVLAIYNLALKENNDAQQIKSCMYQIKYRNVTEEENNEKNIFFVDTLIAKATSPAKNILQSMQAEMFWQYLQNNRWKFYSRTTLANEKSNDISTWSLDKLHASIAALYKSSLSNTNVLQKTKLDQFDAIINKGENTRQLRPTLYDFLIHRALEYFVTDETDLTKPAYQFEINDAKAFAPAAEFVSASFETKDTASLHHHALLLFQQILQFHLKDANPDALLDADFIRLNFVHQYAINSDKEKLYEAALKNIETKYASNAAAAQAMYLRAGIYFKNGQDYDPFTKTDNQYEIKRAKELCEAAVSKFPKSEGGINAKNLLSQIKQPSLNIETEKVNVPGQPFRSLVKYKNVKTVFFRLVKITREELKKFDRTDYEKVWQQYVNLKPVKSWSVDLPDPLDYQEHATEIKVDAADNGMYFILASINQNFLLQQNILAKQITYVSNISYIHNNENNYYILHRDNGQPLADSKIQLWESKYDYNNSRYIETKAEQYTADKNGFFKVKRAKDQRNFLLQVTNGTDELFMDDNNYYDVYDSYRVPIYERTTSFLFTDRSIYRPGQTVYFKGIVIHRENKVGNSKVIPSFNTALQLRDANGQKIDELKMTTNEFGSYHGSFKLPQGSLNGQFSIVDTVTNSTQYFSVEEYKRPKFSVEIKKPTGTYRVNDSIKVTGLAKAYAGNAVDGAAVKYRVVRKVQYPIWWYGGFIRKGRGRIWPPYGRGEQMEITNGTVTTGVNGEFEIHFKAIPDESINKKDQPTFYYEVSADVTDINGETRSGETSVAVAYQALKLDIAIDDKVPADSMKKILVNSTNMNDLPEKTSVTVSIEQLKSPGKIFRERYWEQPDQFVMSKDEYYGNFPYDVYKNEDEVKNYQVGDKILEKTDSSNIDWPLNNYKWKAGWYKIIATTKDKYGEDVKAEKFIQVLSEVEGSGGKGLSEPVPSTAGVESPVTINKSKTIAEPGEKIIYNIQTGFDNVWLIHAISNIDSSYTSNYVTVQKDKPYKNEISITEDNRGGMAMSYAFVKHNRVYDGEEYFTIPWSNKDLNISYQTFRDKLLPGAEEKWSVTISGNKGDKVAAEMLVGMYDASLDQFKPHQWNTINIWPSMYNRLQWTKNGFTSVGSEEHNTIIGDDIDQMDKSYDQLLEDYKYTNLFIGGGPRRTLRSKKGDVEMARAAPAGILTDSASFDLASNVSSPKHMKMPKPVFEDTDGDGIPDQVDKEPNSNSKGKSNSDIQIRKNFNETAFFFPELKTDAAGNVSFSATMPEALTQWKLMTFAHTKELASAYTENLLVTQKQLMVQPNAPRFLREGDQMEFSAKIINLSDSELTGTATLELLDAATNKQVDGWFNNVFPNQYFTVAAGQSMAVKFPLQVPISFNSALTYRVVAKAKNFSDGEEMALPVLTNRTLVTESLPLNVRNTNKKDFKFEKLLNSGKSESISNHSLTIEYSSNPIWYAVQALPYLMEYPYECAEQTFNRYYANALASFVSNSTPKIKAVFEKWKTTDTSALMSNLQKNEELKSALLEETPWVMDAKNESEQKKNIALLFDMVRMSNESEKAIAKLKEMQSSNGGFVWFKGGPDDRYITQYIISSIGHLKKLGVLQAGKNSDITKMVAAAIPYLDKKIKDDYDWLVKHKVKLSGNNLSGTAVQYLYMRSFFSEYAVPQQSKTAYQYYVGQAKKYWLSNGKYMQAMIALILQHNKDNTAAKAIIKSLKENSITNEEMGMYWKEWNNRGWFWYQAPIESQAMMIEAFTEIDQKQPVIDDLKTWLLKQKQTQNWGTTKATAEACYALLLGGSNWLAEEKEVTIQLGDKTVSSNNAEAGTGYFKQRIDGKDVKPEMGQITVTISQSPKVPQTAGSEGASWGSVYWQYFEDLDKITPSATPLKLVKKLFVERNTDKGPVLEALEDGATIKVGDKIKVRIELKVDRDMEYVHMKDMRAACMEPVNVLSGYKYQGGLGYYESTKDASTNFFFSWLNKGTYVFEYPLFVTHEGDFSNGITTIQCMYAPEFTSHSEGVRLKVE